MEINDKEYWDKRFKEDWEANDGPSQTMFFYNLALTKLPQKISNEIEKQSLSILDWGCAQGEGANILFEKFGKHGNKIVGLDISEEATKKAQKNYPYIDFRHTPLQRDQDIFGVVFTSNTLEHFKEPLAVLKELCRHADRYLIGLVPFQEWPRIQEHFCTFNYSSFPSRLGEFFLIHFSVIKEKSKYWNGLQAFFVYAKKSTRGKLSRRLLEKRDLLVDVMWRTPVVKYAYKCLQIIRYEGFAVFLRKLSKKVKKGVAKLLQMAQRLLLSQTMNLSLPTTSNRYDVIFFAIIDWDFRFQRPQHLSTRFAKRGHRVFYISVSLQKQASYVSKQVCGNVYEIKLPYKDESTIYNTNIQDGSEVLNTAISTLFADFGIKDAISFIEFPRWYPLAKYLHQEYGTKIVFDCLDEFAGFAGIDGDILAAQEILLRDCDFCIATSTRLCEILKQKREEVAIVRNATEFEHFHNLPPNKLLEHINKPIIGYYGAIAEWFDTDIVEYIATHKPDWNVVLIGHALGSDIGRLKKYPNVYLLGEKPYSDIPKYLYWFDVCIIPFKLIDLILSANPVKFYEIASSGKPVVSVRIPELLPYENLAYLCSGKEEFLKNIEAALEEKNEYVVNKRIEFARANNWDSRFDEIIAGIASSYPLVSIIVVTFNNLDYTQRCIDSIYEKTAYPDFELIIVDNGSTDGTDNYLKALQEKHKNVMVILNGRNLGFASANNMGIKRSNGEYMIFLNNDTVVTRGWVSGLLFHLQQPNAGMVGPVTNSIGNEAAIETDYMNLSGMEMFAENYTAKHRKVVFEIPVLAMYCVAISRQTVEKVGLLDEQFSIGMFEDDDYALRVKKAGLKVICAEDVFIHHFGGVSFKKLRPTERQRVFDENKKKYESKWAITWQPHRYRNEKV